MLAALLIAAVLAISGCTSPSPSPSPSAIVSPTATPTTMATVSPSPTANASPTATVLPTASAAPTIAPTVVAAGNLAASGISIVSDTSDPLQHDTAQLTLNNTGTSVLSDVTVVYTVVTPFIMVNPDGTTSTTSNQTATSTVYVGKMSPAEIKTVTIKSPDHAKNVPAYVTIKATWKGGEATILRTTIQAPDNKMSTQKY